MNDVTNKIGALYAYDIDKNGLAAQIDPSHLNERPKNTEGYRWVHLDLEHPSARDWIEAQTDQIVADSLTLDDTRPRLSLIHI